MKRIFLLAAVVLIALAPTYAQKNQKKQKSNKTTTTASVKEVSGEQTKEKDRVTILDFPKVEQLEKNHKNALEMKRFVFSTELKLDKEVFEQFWKVYVDYDHEIFVQTIECAKFRQDVFEKYQGKEGIDPYKEIRPEEAEKLMKMTLESDRKKIEISERYLDRFLQIFKMNDMLKYMDLEQKLTYMEADFNKNSMKKQASTKAEKPSVPVLKK